MIRGLTFTDEMMRAIDLGVKTQTRRLLKLPKWFDTLSWLVPEDRISRIIKSTDAAGFWSIILYEGKIEGGSKGGVFKAAQDSPCRYGVPGDSLYTRQCYAYAQDGTQYGTNLLFRALGHTNPRFGKWRPAIFQPRDYARWVLKITDIRAQRLCEISEADAAAECFGAGGRAIDKIFGRSLAAHLFRRPDTARNTFFRAWDWIHGRGACEKNPFVWAITFKPMFVTDDNRQELLGA